jgi:hypothetical protein
MIGFASRFRTVGYMKHRNQIVPGFVTGFFLAGCLAAAGQGAGVFTSTGSLNFKRFNHTATLLPNGKVLIAEGYTIDAYDNTGLPPYTGLYDPATGVSSSRRGSTGENERRHS